MRHVACAFPAKPSPGTLLTTPAHECRSLSYGGDQYGASSGIAIDVNNLPTNLRSSHGLPAVTATRIDTLLANDPYFAQSYRVRRYDDFRWDGHGDPARAGEGFYIRTDAQTRSPDALLDQGLFAASPATNCLLVAAAFSPATRYQLVFNVTNPAQPDAAIRVWAAPLTVDTLDGGAWLGMRTRGPKYGRSCAPHADQPTELHAPPALPADLRAPVAPAACTEAHSPRAGGECLACAPGAADPATMRCVCPPASLPSRIGNRPCAAGTWLRGAGDVADPATLAAALCTKYSALRDGLPAHTSSDAVVGEASLYAFLADAGALVDFAAVRPANDTLFARFVRDARQPASPTRQHGLAPKCITCRDGLVTDGTSGRQSPLYDRRFKALVQLRLIGLLLHLSAPGATPDTDSPHACPALFDWRVAPNERIGVPDPGRSITWPRASIDDSRLQPGDIF